MDLHTSLIESGKGKSKRNWKQLLTSLVLHVGLVGSLIALGTASHHAVAEKPIRVFVTHVAAAAPPPPPPPPPASGGAPKSTPHPVMKPIVPQPSFVQPREIPAELPKVESAPVSDTPMASATSDAADSGGKPEGVPGGVAGGVEGGVAGGTVGGQIGGQIGGQLGGVLGGTVGGTGTAPAPDANGPLRVGGDVKAPVVVRRVQPNYPEIARKGHVAGVVIVEAIIDKEGNVDHVKVLKGLPMGLSDEAERTVKQWKFRPGTMNGEPVDVIFNLVVDFKLDGSGAGVVSAGEKQ